MSIKRKIYKSLKILFNRIIPIKILIYEGNLLQGKTALITGGTSWNRCKWNSTKTDSNTNVKCE